MFVTFERLLIVINVGGYFRLNSEWIFLPSTMNHFKMDLSVIFWCFFFLVELYIRMEYQKNVNERTLLSLTFAHKVISLFMLISSRK